MIVLKVLTAILLGIAMMPCAQAQSNSANEAQQIGTILDIFDANMNNDAARQEEIYYRVMEENAERERQQREYEYHQMEQQRQYLQNLQYQRQQEQHYKAYEAQQAELAAIQAAQQAQRNTQYSGSAGRSIASYGSSGVVAGGAVTSGSGIVIDDMPSIDDIGIARPSAPRTQTPASQSTQRNARTCTCPAGTFEYYGVECKMISSYEAVSSPPGGNYPFHKNCDATYNDPTRISEY